jgi:hypothetical protein
MQMAVGLAEALMVGRGTTVTITEAVLVQVPLLAVTV